MIVWRPSLAAQPFTVAACGEQITVLLECVLPCVRSGKQRHKVLVFAPGTPRDGVDLSQGDAERVAQALLKRSGHTLNLNATEISGYHQPRAAGLMHWLA